MRGGAEKLWAALAWQLLLTVFLNAGIAQQPGEPPSVSPATRLPPDAPATAVPSLVFPEGFPSLPTATHDASSIVAAPYPVTQYAELHSPNSDYGSNSGDSHAADDPTGVYDYRVLPSLLPEYYYRGSYYVEPGMGARPLADYAPAGYEPRDYQDSPAVPEFTPLTPPPRPSPAAANTFVTRGMMPGSFLVPGANTSFRLRGFVRLAAMNDFDPIGSADSFVTNTIPVPQSDGQNYNMSARMSRFALESWTPTTFHEWNAHTFIEGDFFNGAPQAAGGGGNPFRLRHAFVDFGYFRFGQQNSVFMDGSNWPSLVDFQGPNSWVNQRQPSARMTIPVTDQLYWAASIERPFSDITTNGLGSNVQRVPDIATHLRYEGDVGHVQVSGLVRTIGYQPTGGDVTEQTAAGVSGNVVVHPWAILLGTDPARDQNPSGLTRSRVLMQVTWGPGVGRYINDLAGQGFDGQVDPVSGQFDLAEATAWNVSYEHWYSENWLSNFTYGNVIVDNNAGQLGTTYDETKYSAASLWWIPLPRMSFGIEFLWGQRQNLNGEDADAKRLGGLFQYNF